MFKAVAYGLSLLVAGLVGASSAWADGGPPRGVYSCYDARMDYKMQLVITPTPVAMFGIIDASTYSDYDGNHGHYTYDAGSGMLTMMDGSRQGWRYHNTGGWSFRLIDNRDGSENYTCPHEPGKNPLRGPW